MSSSVDHLLMLALASALLSGCYTRHTCGEERCNLVDDDCDGQVDEDFLGEDGEYRSVEHCGECGIDCRAAFPTAQDVACEQDSELGPICVLVSCPAGFHRGDAGSCVPDVPVLCLPCEADADCALRVPGARCLETGSGQSRCGQPCGDGALCPEGFSCTDGQCAPNSEWCGCSEATEGVELACLLRVDAAGHACVGVQRCGVDGPGECEPALGEACNAIDDDCDGATDEDFRDEEGRYVDRLHCGGCAIPCAEPGPNMIAECLPEGATSVRCSVECLEGFVDVDGILANGCECERWDGMGPPPVIGGDADCDGAPDDTDDFIYVTTTGSDTNPGTLAHPMRTLNAALARGRAADKDVLVARGIYEGPLDLVGGVSIFGGYSSDFRDRDLELFPVVIERRTGEPGMPAVTCRAVTAPTRVEGFTVVGLDATGAGDGSTAIFIDGCGAAVSFAAIDVFAGRGSDGQNGRDSSERLAEWGIGSLDDLDGVSGTEGRPGNDGAALCTTVPGGSAGRHVCRGVDVSGGGGGAAACPETGCVNGSPCGNAGCTDYTVGGVCDFDAVLRDAVPNPAPTPGRGPAPGAAAVRTYNSPTNRGVCNFCDDNPTLPRDTANGNDGGGGDDGIAGTGCMSAPVLDASGRIAGGSGTEGAPGQNGSGGGGASAGAGYDVIGGTSGTCSDRSGGSGGGGGSGGCGAPGAGQGTGGGTSAGIVIRLASGSSRGPTFEDVRVVTASGGRGGDGGVGADGGLGGVGGNGGVGRFWCARTGGRGGDGGRGGAGGGGGGGCGGGSHGVYVVTRGADASAYGGELGTTLTIEETGVAGRGGRGGFSPGASGSPGSDGTGAPITLVP